MEALLRGDKLKTSAEIAEICEYTSFIWRHKILSICATLTDEKPVLNGKIELDEKLASVCNPGVKGV